MPGSVQGRSFGLVRSGRDMGDLGGSSRSVAIFVAVS